MTKIYGIKNCTTVRSALKFLEENGVDFVFFDFRAKDFDRGEIFAEKIRIWMKILGQSAIYNENSIVFKKLALPKNPPENEAIALCQQHPNIIKRPILEAHEEIVAGFDKIAKEKYVEILKLKNL